LSALVLELAAALATALVAVEVGLRLLAGHLGYQTALLVLLLTPEAYLPLRALGAQFHASMEGATAAARACAILDTEPPGPAPAPAPRRPRAQAGRAGPGRPAEHPHDAERSRGALPSPPRAGPGQSQPGDGPGRADRGARPGGGGKDPPAAPVVAFPQPGRGD